MSLFLYQFAPRLIFDRLSHNAYLENKVSHHWACPSDLPLDIQSEAIKCNTSDIMLTPIT